MVTLALGEPSRQRREEALSRLLKVYVMEMRVSPEGGEASAPKSCRRSRVQGSGLRGQEDTSGPWGERMFATELDVIRAKTL